MSHRSRMPLVIHGFYFFQMRCRRVSVRLSMFSSNKLSTANLPQIVASNRSATCLSFRLYVNLGPWFPEFFLHFQPHYHHSQVTVAVDTVSDLQFIKLRQIANRQCNVRSAYQLVDFFVVFAARQSDSFYSGICHRIRVGLAESQKRFWTQLNSSKTVRDRPYVSIWSW